MNTKTTISISEARKNIFDIAEEVQKPNNYYTFTEKGKPKAVLMSAEDFESWQETIEVSALFPDLQKEARGARREYKAGKCVTLGDYLNSHGFSTFTSKKSTKRNRKSR